MIHTTKAPPVAVDTAKLALFVAENQPALEFFKAHHVEYEPNLEGELPCEVNGSEDCIQRAIALAILKDNAKRVGLATDLID